MRLPVSSSKRNIFCQLLVLAFFPAWASPIPTTSGISLQNLNPELLFERSSLVNQVLARHMDTMVTKSSGTPYDQEIWLEPYAAHYSRATNTTSSLPPHYIRNIDGGALGVKLGRDSHLYAVLSVDHSKVNVENKTQILRSNTAILGLFGQQLFHIGPMTFSPKFLFGYAENQSQRRQAAELVPSSYTSYLALTGLNAEYALAFTTSTQAKLIADVDLSAQSNAAYQEKTYYEWNAQTLTQLSSGIHLELAYTTQNKKTTCYIRGGILHRKLLSGKSNPVTINGVPTVFNETLISDTYLAQHIGLQYSSSPSVVTYLDLSQSQSNHEVKNTQVMLGLGIGF